MSPTPTKLLETGRTARTPQHEDYGQITRDGALVYEKDVLVYDLRRVH
jgi:hypothetical protein